ncbi:MAG: ABC transporter permease [Acidobacteriota bacterium]
MRAPETTVVDAQQRALSDLGELWRYRDLLFFMVWRDVKSRYAQSVLGIGWAVIQPLFTMLVFTVVFGNLAKIDSDGQPYAIFSFAALVPWTYFSGALGEAAGSLVSSASLMTKVYFPRLIIPVASVVGKLIDLLIAGAVLAGLLVFFRAEVQPTVLLLPALVLLMAITALGAGLWLTPLAVQYRDVKHLVPFGIQLLMYASPIVYPLSLVPERFRLAYSLNPMVGVVEGFRAALLGTRPMPWPELGLGTATAAALLLSGYVYFRRADRHFADVA